MATESSNYKYEIYACLPFVDLGESGSVSFGPVHFWSADRAEQYVDESLTPLLLEYLTTVTNFKTWSHHELVDTGPLKMAEMTCVSIDPQVPLFARNGLLVDAIYLLFFCGAFSHLYSHGVAPGFDVCTKMLPASPTFLQDRGNWADVHIPEAKRELPVILERFDEEMCRGLGHALACGYSTDLCKSTAETAKVQSLIRAIRYFVDRFFGRFENLIGNSLRMSDVIYEAEDIVFLETSFEALFDLVEEHPHIDLKHKLRPMLGLRYSAPVELLWQWVDGFFDLRQQIVHGKASPDEVFNANPNFEVSYFYLGMKLFLYGVYWRLHTYQLINGRQKTPDEQPLRFDWVQPEELLAFFWPEEALIHRICRTMRELQKDSTQADLKQDLKLLGDTLAHIYHRYGHNAKDVPAAVKWKGSPKKRIAEPIGEILDMLGDASLAENLPKDFATMLQQRLPALNK